MRIMFKLCQKLSDTGFYVAASRGEFHMNFLHDSASTTSTVYSFGVSFSMFACPK
jgi:hypothetical protein